MPIIMPNRSRPRRSQGVARPAANGILARANAALAAGELGRAEQLFAVARSRDSRSPAAARGHGFALLQQNRLAEAMPALEQALVLAPEDPQSHHVFGHLCLRLCEPELALRHFRTALRQVPGSEAARSGLATALTAQGRADEALSILDEVLAGNPRSEVGWLNSGIVHERLGQHGEAQRCYDALLAFNPRHASARYHRSLLLLRAGEFDAGWADYELRFAAGFVPPPAARSPRWCGDRTGHLLVVAEQGLGDAIHFARFLPLLRAHAERVTFACSPSLHRLFARSVGVDALAGMDREDWPAHDAHLPLMSVPSVLGLGGAAARDAGRYLTSDPELGAVWAARIGATSQPRGTVPSLTTEAAVPPGHPPIRKVGIVWSTSTAHATETNPYTRRSCPVTALSALADAAGIRLFSLQVGAPAGELSRAALPVIDLASELNDFDDTAAAIEQLDAVVTVDTAVAHLAAALAKPVHLLLPSSANWQWMTGSLRTPWYGTIALARQAAAGDWSEPVRVVARRLSPLAHDRTGGR